MESSSWMTCAAKVPNPAQSRTHDQFDLSMFAQFISLIYAEKELPDQVPYVKLAFKGIQSSWVGLRPESKLNK